MEDDQKELLRDLMEQQDEDGWTPLHQASVDGNKRKVELLLKYGATAQSDYDGVTPLDQAVKSYDRKRNSTHPNVRKESEETFPDIIRMLKEAEAKRESESSGQEMTQPKIVPDKNDRAMARMLYSNGFTKEDGSFTKDWIKYLKKSGFIKCQDQ